MRVCVSGQSATSRLYLGHLFYSSLNQIQSLVCESWRWQLRHESRIVYEVRPRLLVLWSTSPSPQRRPWRCPKMALIGQIVLGHYSHNLRTVRACLYQRDSPEYQTETL